MKYLQDYMSDRQTALFNETKTFFAFSKKQLEEGMAKQGLTDRSKLTNCGMGMIVPDEHLDRLMTELDKIYTESIAQDIEENGRNAIIIRELNNHEAYYTHDIESTWEALKDYPGITEYDVARTFKNKNYDPDLRNVSKREPNRCS